MKAMGFADAQLSSPGADGGIDVVATNAAAQVKAHGKIVLRETAIGDDRPANMSVARGRGLIRPAMFA